MKIVVMNKCVAFVSGCGLAVMAGLFGFVYASGPRQGDPRPYIYMEGGVPQGAAAAVQVAKEYQFGKLIGMDVTLRLFGDEVVFSLPGENSYRSPSEKSPDMAATETMPPDVAALQAVLTVVPVQGAAAGRLPVHILDDRRLIVNSADSLTEYLVAVEDGALSVEEYALKEPRRGSRGTYVRVNGGWGWQDEPGMKAARQYRVPAEVKADYLRLWVRKIHDDLSVSERNAYTGMTVHESGEISIGIESVWGDGSRQMMSCLCRWQDGKWQVVFSAC